MKITKRTADAANAKAGRFILWDEDVKGFGLLVLPTGVKSYLYKYRTAEGIQRRLTLGQHGELTPQQARDKAAEFREIVRNGGDPLGKRQALRYSLTVGDILDAYLKSASFAGKAPSTQAIDRGRIERHLRPIFGKRHAHLLTDDDVRRGLAAIRDGKTAAVIKTKKQGKAVVRGGPGTAKLAIDLLKHVFNWSQEQKLVADNPCSKVKTGASGTRETILESAEDYQRLFQTLATMEEELRIQPAAADAIRLIALTGCRRGEAINLRWSHVDLKRGLITLPPQSHKTGRATGKPRVIGLPTPAQEIIARQPKGQAGDYVFAPARGEGGAISISHVWDKVRKEAGLPATIGLHGLRHSLATSMAMGGAQAAEIMAALGHRQLATAQRYIHYAENRQQALAQRAASTVMAGMAAAKNNGKSATIRAIKA